jgi:plasmid maintenance system killer protein
MHIRRFRHKDLKNLYESDNLKGVEVSMADRLRKQLLAIETAAGLKDLERFPDGDCML